MHPCILQFLSSSRRRHTRLQGDWSSDVCSSDLRFCAASFAEADRLAAAAKKAAQKRAREAAERARPKWVKPLLNFSMSEIGRASCRERRQMSGGDVAFMTYRIVSVFRQ